MEIMNGRAKKNLTFILPVLSGKDNSFLTRFIRFGPLLVFFLLFLLAEKVVGQTLTCNPAPINAPKEIAVNQNCEGVILPAIIVDTASTTYLSSNMSIALFTQAGTLIKKDTGSLTVNLNPYLGTIVRIEILVFGTPFSCNGYARIVDKMPPVISCRDTVVSCSVDTSGINLGRPVIIENNCNSTLTYNYKDSVSVSDCSMDTLQRIFRRWIVADIYGNADTCFQKISLLKPSLDSLTALRRIVFPRDTLLSCNTPNVSPERTGYPTINGSNINSPGLCKINYSFTDDTTRTCAGVSFAVIRRWTAIDLCTSQDTLHTQIIQVKDTTKPVIVCPVPKRVSTQPSICMALVPLSAPQLITDNCDPAPNLMVTTPFSGTYPNLISMPLGTHTISYMAIDKCGNTAVCTSTVEVFDTTPPVAICKGAGNITLTNEGTAYASARAFDSGSRDNCGLPVYYKVKRKVISSCNGSNGDDSPASGYQEWFDDFVTFCCEDVDKGKITVELRVYIANPGDGPVDPNREAPGGDLYGNFYNTCEVNMTVEDKLPPVIICPSNKNTECNDELINLGRFGSPIVLEACSYTLDSTHSVKMEECNTGLLTRTFTATDARGLKASCTQTINIQNNSVLLAQHITWPADVTINSCNAQVGVNDLPVNSRRPAVNEPLCAQIAYAYTDNVFNMTSPGCFKVYRTWEVVDLCKYVPGIPGHRFTHAQLIIVEDKTPPVLSVPPNQTVNLFTDCNVAQVTIPLATATDNCNQNLEITNNSPFANQNGANASGTYPLGTTTFTFSVSDGCGNKVTRQMSVTVIDKKPPTPICKNIAVNLSKMPAIMAMVDAKAINLASRDVCGGPIKISIKRGNSGERIPPHPLDTMLTFTCADFGIQPVELWVTDAKGNSDFCTATVDVQDNDGLCLTNPIGKIAGVIKTEK
ncbi:MAG: HYR domain-containing protein, partial [Bacteroidota bacterium]